MRSPILASAFAASQRPGDAANPASETGAAKEYSRIRWPDIRTLLALKASRLCLEALPEAERTPHVDIIMTVDAGNCASRRKFDASLDNPKARANTTSYLSGMVNAPAASIAMELGLDCRTLTLCRWGQDEWEAFSVADDWLARGLSRQILIGCVHDLDSAPSGAYACFFLALAGSPGSLVELLPSERPLPDTCAYRTLLAHHQGRDPGTA